MLVATHVHLMAQIIVSVDKGARAINIRSFCSVCTQHCMLLASRHRVCFFACKERHTCPVQAARIQDVAVGVALGFVLQIGLAAPFLAVAPESYLSRAFEFSRCEPCLDGCVIPRYSILL